MKTSHLENSAIIELQYLPPIAYFKSLGTYSNVIIESNEHFVKQTYRNRCYLAGANKIQMLSVPVIGGNSKILIRDIKIDYNQNWLNNHRRSLSSAYGKAPFYEYYAPYFDQVYDKKHKYLFDLNWEMLTLCLHLLQINVELSWSKKYQKLTEKSITDLRSASHPKIRVPDTFEFLPQAYQQVFGRDFVANLSIIDLLFCEGPNASMIISHSGKSR